MTIEVSLNSEQEKRLREAAHARGVDTESLLRDLVEKGLNECGSHRQDQPQRILGLHAGKIWISEDFDDPLPEGFWLGQE